MKIMVVLVIGVLSGDSLSVRMNNEVYRVQVAGISAPKRGDRYSIDAEQFLAKLCFQKTAWVQYEEINNRTLVGRTKCGTHDAAVEMMRSGWVRPTNNDPVLLAEYQKSQQRKVGFFREEMKAER